MYTNRPLQIILIDDDPQMREMLNDFFTGKYAHSHVKTIVMEPNLIVLDYHLDSSDAMAMKGLQVLKKLKEKYPLVPVIFLSGQEKAEVAANTMKYGAYDYIVKNESAFHRLEILFNNILGHVELKKNLGTQKFFNGILVALVAAMIIAFIVSKMS